MLAAELRVFALQPGEVAAGVDVQEVGHRGVTNLHRNIVVAAVVQKSVSNIRRKKTSSVRRTIKACQLPCNDQRNIHTRQDRRCHGAGA